MKIREQRLYIDGGYVGETHVGALISKQHMENVLAYIEVGKQAGATVVIGGGRPSDENLQAGYFVEPTVFDACEDDMAIVREEIFGPVMTVLTFPDEDDVVARLEAGTIWINNYNITPIELPFGGYKQSGIGRENSLTTINHYTQIKSVYVEMGDVEAPY